MTAFLAGLAIGWIGCFCLNVIRDSGKRNAVSPVRPEIHVTTIGEEVLIRLKGEL